MKALCTGRVIELRYNAAWHWESFGVRCLLMVLETRKISRKALSAGWHLMLLGACSRTALQNPERVSDEFNVSGEDSARGERTVSGEGGAIGHRGGRDAGAFGGNAMTLAQATGGSLEVTSNGGYAGAHAGSPNMDARRWIAISAQGPNGKMQAHGIRFGKNDIEDHVRLDSVNGGFDRVFGKFSPMGRGYALRVEDQSIYRAERLIDFKDTRPKFIEFPPPAGRRVNRFGPWLDDHRIIVYEQSLVDDFAAANCRVLDLNHVDSPQGLDDSGLRGATFVGDFRISPTRRWLFAVARFGQVLSVFMARVTQDGVGSWTKVVELAEGQVPARATYSHDEGYMYLQKVMTMSSVIVGDVDIVRLTEPPVGSAAFSLPAEESLNYIMAAPSGSLFLTHTTRLPEGGDGTNPIRVVDAETGASAIVTPKYTASYSEGFTWGGHGLVVSGYGAEFGTSSVDWLDFSDKSKPPSASQLLCDGGAPMFLGRLTEDGRVRYGICSGSTGATVPLKAPVVLARYDFTPTLLGPTQLSRLTERANVTNYEFAPDNSALVYSALSSVDSGVLNEDGKRELGTFWVSMTGGLPRRLALAWRDDQVTWLPNAEGLLRVGWKNSTTDPTDVTWAEHLEPNEWHGNAPRTMHWLRFDASVGIVTDLTAYLAVFREDIKYWTIDTPDTWGQISSDL